MDNVPQRECRVAKGTLRTVASQWIERYRPVEGATPGPANVSPVLIVVRDKTEITEFVFRRISASAGLRGGG